MDIYTDLKEIIEGVVGPRRLTPELQDHLLLDSDLHIDSPRLVEIVLDIEARYSIQIPDEEMERLQSIGDLVRLVSASVTSSGHTQ
jgi:acyl carrier protein